MNTELFKKIDAIINPRGLRVGWRDGFDMSSWEGDSSECGTTRCLSGWAIHLTTGTSLYDWSSLRQTPETVELARKLGTRMFSTTEADFESLGAKLLGLTGPEGKVFYANEDIAAEFTHLAAQGRDDEARELLRNS